MLYYNINLRICKAYVNSFLYVKFSCFVFTNQYSCDIIGTVLIIEIN